MHNKCFQFFPLRTEIIPKCIQIDNKVLVELLMESKTKFLSDLTVNRKKIWEQFFKLNHKIFRNKNYEFDYFISTDGHSCSLRFINKKYVEQENIKKANIKAASNATKKANKNLSEQEKSKIKQQKIKYNNEKEIKRKLEQKDKRDKEKEEFKKLTKEEKEIKINNKAEFKYINKLSKEKLEELKTKNKIYVDPGKRSIFYMMDDNEKIFNYTNKQRVKETKRLIIQDKVKRYKDENNITMIENKLSNYNSKTVNYEKFKEYIKAKSLINNKLFKEYEDVYFRKMKWYSFINTKRSEDRLLNKIEEFYKDEKNTKNKPVIILGDCSTNNNLKFISTPNISLKRKLKERFEVYLIDEFRTSELNYKTGEKQENLYLAKTIPFTIV